MTGSTWRIATLGPNGEELLSDPVSLPDLDQDGIADVWELGAAYTGAAGTCASNAPAIFTLPVGPTA